MPTYLHICTSPECNNEWEDFYSIVKDPPTTCPKCNQETAKRVMSMRGEGKDVVELYGQDLVDKVKSDAKQLKRDMGKNERLYSSMLGEDKYQSVQQRIDKQRR